MTEIRHEVTLDASQVEQAAVRMKLAFNAPRENLAALVADFDRLKAEGVKLAVSITPLDGGLSKVAVSMKSSATEAAQLGANMLNVANSTKVATAALEAAGETAQRVRGLQQIAASSANAKFDLAQQFQQVPVNQIDAFNRLMLGGAQNVAAYRDRMTEAQNSSRVFASILLSQPAQALKTLATDSRAAGAAMAFLRAELDFVVGSRFGAIAIGFAVFGTIEEAIRRSVGALVEFEAKFARVEALSVGTANAVNINARAQQFLFDAALKTGRELGDLADKYLVAASATNSETTAQGLFTNALRFSTATGADFKSSLLLLSGVLNTYGDTLGASLTDTEKLEVLTSKLFTTFKLSRGEGDDFVQALQFVSASAKISHISFDSLLGVLGGLADKMQEGSRGGRGFGQVLTTIIKQADRFNEAFNLGLSKREIIEAPLAALEALRKQIQGGTIDVTRFTAEVADLFPMNAARVFLSMQQLTTAEVQRYTDEIKKAVDIQKVADKALENTQVQWGILKRVVELSLAAGFNGSKDLGELLKTLVIPAVATLGQGFILIMSNIRLAMASAIGLGLALSQVGLGNLRNAKDLLVATKAEMADIVAKSVASIQTLENLGKGFDNAAGKVRPYKDILAEANEAMEKAAKAEEDMAKARVSRGERGQPISDVQQLELDIARGLTVELEKQIRIKEEVVRKGEQAAREALTTKDAARAHSELISALKALEATRLQALKDANESLLLQSEQLTEKHRSQAVVTQEFAAQEIAARRGIIAALQGEQAQVEALAAARQISAQEASRQLVQLQRQQNAQLQSMKSVAEAANKADRERLEAATRLREAQDKVTDSEQAVGHAHREQQQQRLKTLEIEAAGRARILLATQLDVTTPLLQQLAVLHQAQDISNLPLQERIQLLQQELDLIKQIGTKEESRLELEIKFGSQLPQLLEAQREATKQLLSSDPARLKAAQELAALRGRPGEEGTINAAAGVLGFSELTTFTEGDRTKEVEALKTLGDRKLQQERLLTEGLRVELRKQAELERERAAAVQKAIREGEQALADQQRLIEEQEAAAGAGTPRGPSAPIVQLPDGTFTNSPIQRQSLDEQESILQEFKDFSQKINVGGAERLLSTFRDIQTAAREVNVELGRMNEAIPAVVSRSGASLIDAVEEKLTDRIANELAFPTWT